MVRAMCKYALLFGLMTWARMNAQPVQVGVKGAVPVLDTTPDYGGESKPYLVGPSVEVRLPKGFAIEVDALYQRVGQTRTAQFGGISAGPSNGFINGVYFNRMRGNSWQFPILGKWYFRERSSAWQPFVSLGPSIRRVAYTYDTAEAFAGLNGLTNFQTHAEHAGNWSVGGTAGAGARFNKGRFAITPEFRYTRWAQNNGSVLSRNAAAFFLGFSL
jgi:hypothetical protein